MKYLKNILFLSFVLIILNSFLILFAKSLLLTTENNKINLSKTQLPKISVETVFTDKKNLVLSSVPDLFLLPTDTKEFEIEHKLQLKSNIPKDKLNQLFIKITQHFLNSSQNFLVKVFVAGIEYNDSFKPKFNYSYDSIYQNFIIKISLNEMEFHENSTKSIYYKSDGQLIKSFIDYNHLTKESIKTIYYDKDNKIEGYTQKYESPSEINLTTTYEIVDSQGKNIGEGKKIENKIINIS